MTNDQIQKSLAEFAPTTLAIDRDALMYRAGFTAARGLAAPSIAASHRTLRLWQSTTALATAASIALALALWQQPAPHSAPQMVTAPDDEVEQLLEHLVEQSPSATETTPVLAGESPRQPRINPLLLADPSSNYFALRATILEHGVDSWPVVHRTYSELPADSERSHPPTARRLMEEMLPPPAKPRESEIQSPHEASNRNEESVV